MPLEPGSSKEVISHNIKKRNRLGKKEIPSGCHCFAQCGQIQTYEQ